MKKPLLLTCLSISACLLAVIGWFDFSFLQRLFAPIYTFEQHLSANGTFMESALSHGDAGILAGPLFTQWALYH